MNKFVSFGGINYAAATFPVSSTAIKYLKTEHLDASTGKVDINGKNLAVKLNADGTVGFGASTPTGADKLLGIIVTYEEDGYAAIQYQGGVEGVPTKAAITTGIKQLVVNNKGQVEELNDSISSSALTKGGRETIVALPSTADDLNASLILN